MILPYKNGGIVMISQELTEIIKAVRENKPEKEPTGRFIPPIPDMKKTTQGPTEQSLPELKGWSA
jgi:hypothetical protein